MFTNDGAASQGMLGGGGWVGREGVGAVLYSFTVCQTLSINCVLGEAELFISIATKSFSHAQLKSGFHCFLIIYSEKQKDTWILHVIFNPE